MLDRPRTVPTAVYLLADHLDAVLAAGEDLLKLRLEIASSHGHVSRSGSQLRGFIERVRVLERSISARALQARRCARELGRGKDQFRPLLVLFASGTTPLQDAINDLADASGEDFDNGDDAIAYLRSRAVLTDDAGSLPETGKLKVSEDFLVAGCIALGPLLDLAATFLDVLDTHYELYAPALAATAPGAEAPRAEANPV